MTLAEKLHAIQKLARRAAKRGKATEGRREYDFLTIEDAVHFGKEQIRKHKLILTPDLKSFVRFSERQIDVVVTWRLEDIQSGDFRIFDIPGSGWDLYSKDTSKAMTASRKTAITTIFNLEVGEENERKTSPSETQTEIATQQLETALGEEFPSLNHAEAAVMDRDEMRNAAKKSMFIAWPDAHNGHRFLLMGRAIAPASLHKIIDECKGKWSDREMGWFIASEHADMIRDTIKKFNLPLIENSKKQFEQYKA